MSLRLPKSRRAARAIPFDLQPRDELMIQACAKFRFLRTNHLLALAGGSEQNLKRRLQKLFHGAYLDRVHDLAEATHYRTHHLGTPKATYGLANLGARYLENTFDYPASKSRWDLLNRRASSQNISHTLFVTNFFIPLFCTIRDHPQAWTCRSR